MTKDEAISKAKKLKALADRGIDGEKVVAGEKLKEIMKKYSLTIADITDTTPKYVFPGPGQNGGSGSAGPQPGSTNATHTTWSHGPQKYFIKVATDDEEFNDLVSRLFFHTQDQANTKEIIREFQNCSSFKKKVYKKVLRERLKQLDTASEMSSDLFNFIKDLFGK